jgi:hypothetical protein
MTFEHVVVFAGSHIVFVALSLFYSARKHVVSVHQQTHLRRTKMSWTQGIQGLNENKKVPYRRIGWVIMHFSLYPVLRIRGSVGSVCFWASWILIRIHQSEVWIRIRIWILLSSSKNSKKNLDSSCLTLTSFYFLSLKNLVFCWHLEGQ